MKVVVDAFGGDNSPQAVVDGVLAALKKRADLFVVLVGDKAKLEALVGKNDRIEIVDAPDVITNDDQPTLAIRQKKDSSLVRAFDVLKEQDDVVGLVSAGNTGAVLTGAILKIGRIKGISRPALCAVLPTIVDRPVMLCDCGSNVDCKTEHLLHFALMASAYYSVLQNEKTPRVGLLNNGTEEHKGNELTKETFVELKKMPINFVGNVEAREIMSGDVDVIVADGFAGNVMLKTLEGAAKGIGELIKADAKRNIFSVLGALLMGRFKRIKKKMDINRYGGAPFLGCKKLVVKTHGSATAENFCNTILQVVQMHESGLNDKIETLVTEMSGKMEIQE